MAKNVKESFNIWLNSPGKSKPRDPENTIRTVELPPDKNLNGWDLSTYLNRWDLIEAKLK